MKHIAGVLNIKKSPEENSSELEIQSLTRRKRKLASCVKKSSSIQTLLSVLEFHQVNRKMRLVDFTTGRELHPALKIYETNQILPSIPPFVKPELLISD
jgi:hypothetical protein